MYEQQQLLNYRITDLQAALGLSQLERLDQIVAERNRQLQRYRELLAALPLQLLEVPKDVFSSVHLAVIRLTKTPAEQHRQIFESLRAVGIGVQLHYTPVHLQPYTGGLDSKRVIFLKLRHSLQCHQHSAVSGLKEKDLQRVANTLSALLKQ